jgi:hypothetical protein
VNTLIKNKTAAIILAILTFTIGSVLITGIIFYVMGFSLSSISEHQTFVFLAILASAVLASFVYGRGSTERASKATKLLNESLGLELNEKDVWKVLRAVEHLPPFTVNKYVSMNINAVEEFGPQIKEYGSKLTRKNLLDIKRIIEMPVPELQDILNKLYLETKLEQFKILAEPDARSLIELNTRELKKILFNE